MLLVAGTCARRAGPWFCALSLGAIMSVLSLLWRSTSSFEKCISKSEWQTQHVMQIHNADELKQRLVDVWSGLPLSVYSSYCSGFFTLF